MKTVFLFLFLFLSLLLSAPLQAYESPQKLQDAFVAAMRAHDVEGLAACYTEDASNFTPDSLIGIGPDSARASWGGFFEQFQIISVELSEQHMEVSGNLAAAWGLVTITAQPKAGGDVVVLQGRYTDVAKKIDGQWLYVADHASFPASPAD